MTEYCWYKNKRIRLNDGCNNNVNEETKQNEHWSCSADTSQVESEILEDMGVSMLADVENNPENILKTQECTIPSTNFETVKLKAYTSHNNEKFSFESNNSDRNFETFGELNEKHANTLDKLNHHSLVNNESGYLSPVEADNLGDTKENTNKEDSNDALEKLIPDFYLYRRKRKPSIIGEDKFNTLSDEMILMILKWLPKKSLIKSMLVCKRWCQIARDEVLWTRLDLGSKVLNAGTLGYILPKGVQILRLAQADISTPIFIENNNLPKNVISKLQYLDLSMAVISVNDLSKLLSTCKYLKKLSLEKCSLNFECCKAISNNTDLEVLNLTMCDGIDTQCVEVILKLKRLSALNMSWGQLDSEAVSKLCKLLPANVARLNIAGCRKTLSDDNLEDLVKSCPNLIELDLSDCAMLRINLGHPLLHLTKLEHLSLSRCYSIHTSMIIRVTQMKSLRFLDIFGIIPDDVMKNFISKYDYIEINKFLYSSIARPTTGVRRTSIWGLRARD